jgi:hypothetical protein
LRVEGDFLSINDYPARGRIKEVRGNTVVFLPAGTNYELYLTSDGPTPAIDKFVEAIIRVTGRKVWTVPSGGNFVAPIFGPPKIIQGRVKWLDERTLVVQAGVPIVVEMPAGDDAIDLACGAIGAGTLVNVTAMAGGTIEFGVLAETRT